jgi:uncharacterized protein (DUF4415 family)
VRGRNGAIESEPDESGLEFDRSGPLLETHRPKAAFNMRVDADVFGYLESRGNGREAKIDAVQRGHAERVKSRA